MNNLKRGVIKIKPVYTGIYHYKDFYGSVFAPDRSLLGKGTIPVSASKVEKVEKMAREMVKEFKKGLKVDFVEVKEPLVIKEQKDLRRLPVELSYDVDALLVTGGTYLERYTLSQYKLPVIESSVSSNFLSALRVKKFLKQSRFLYIGEIPSFTAPSGPWDFFALEKRLGCRVRHIETNEFYRHFDYFSEGEVKKELDNWKKNFDRIVKVSKEELMNATRVYLALRHLCFREDANGVAINCGRLTEERPVVPCLAFDRLIDEGIMCACEGDITAMLSSLILHAVSGQSVLMGNFNVVPRTKDEITISHGIIPLSMANTGFIIRDYHGRTFGVTGYAEVKTEPMTLLNIDKSLNKVCVIEGAIKDSEDGINYYADGKDRGMYCRIAIYMNVDGDIKKIPEIIVGSQHISMTFGHWLHALKKAGSLLGFEVQHP
ncbi:hypothetical protein HQ584_05410 [Patescibacteria group bacterium]|nr:hypothetical protein [Patescibacteria group bacterium]